MMPEPAHPIRTIAAFANAKQPKKRVRFQPSITVQPIDCTMTQHDKASSYYTKDELDAFQLEVKVINTLFKTGSGSHRSKEDCVIGTNADPALYALPVRNKTIAQKALLKYQHNLNARDNMTTEHKHRRLAKASVKLSTWSKEMAQQTAKMDTLRAYDGDYMVHIVEQALEQVSSLPASIKRRRVNRDEEASQNYKRRC